MIIVNVTVTLEAAATADLKQAIQAMDLASNAEAGCRIYATSQDVNDAKVLRIYEEWETLDALMAHFQTPHMAAFQQAFAGVAVSGMTRKAYEVAGEVELPNA